MKVLFDTNIILDVLLDRKPFADHASFLMSRVEQAEIKGFRKRSINPTGSNMAKYEIFGVVL